MLDIKTFNSALEQLEEERGISKEKIMDAIETAIAAAYKKDYGKKGQIIRASFDPASGKAEFTQIKIVVDDSIVKMPEETEAEEMEEKERVEEGEIDARPRFNPEHHILIEDAKKIKKDVELEDEVEFPLEAKDDYGRIAAQTAKQVIIQKIREAEKVSILDEYEEKEGSVVTGIVQRIERGNVFVDLGRIVAMLPYEEQIPGEHYRQGGRIKAYIYEVSEGQRGVQIRLSRTNSQFLKKLFEVEVPEIAADTVEIKNIAREPGSRSKIAVHSNDDKIDPIGACVGQRGIRINAIMSELAGEKIDVIEWSEDFAQFIRGSLSPAKIIDMEINESERRAKVKVDDDQFSLAIGKGGQNVRLAARLTGWKIDIEGTEGEKVALSDGENVEIQAEKEVLSDEEIEEIKGEEELEKIEEETGEKQALEEELKLKKIETHETENHEGITPEEVEEQEAEVEEIETNEDKAGGK